MICAVVIFLEFNYTFANTDAHEGISRIRNVIAALDAQNPLFTAQTGVRLGDKRTPALSHSTSRILPSDVPPRDLLTLEKD